MSMNPGATARPAASISGHVRAASTEPTAAMRPSSIATSACDRLGAGAVVDRAVPDHEVERHARFAVRARSYARPELAALGEARERERLDAREASRLADDRRRRRARRSPAPSLKQWPLPPVARWSPS